MVVVEEYRDDREAKYMALPMWVSKLENKFLPLKVLLNLRRRAAKLPGYISFQLERKKRCNPNYIDDKFLKIRKLQGKYYGERCFIIATGPSLTIEDIELLKDEYTFGMNSICKIYSQTTWRPTFYGIQDRHVFEKLRDIVFNQDPSTIMFLAEELCKNVEMHDNYVAFPYDVGYHYINLRKMDDYFAKFSEDCYDVVYDGYSITYSLIQIAVYMGFKEIYLLGADCSYTVGSKNHFVESGYIDKNANLNHDKMIKGYEAAKKYADEKGIQIINCTRGGMLEVYDRKSLEAVLKR